MKIKTKIWRLHTYYSRLRVRFLGLKTPKAATVKRLKGSKVRIFSEEEVAIVKTVQRNMQRRRRFVTVKKKMVQSEAELYDFLF
jgi:hypothetical protein